MTPAIHILLKNKIPHTIHEYVHDPSQASYGAEAAEKLGVNQDRVFKTLVVDMGDNGLAVGVIPVSCMLNMKLFARASGSKKAVMADKKDVERSTGYVLGGVSPLGQKKRLKTIIHSSAKEYPTLFVSAGRRGLEIEISPQDLKTLTAGAFDDICMKK